MLINEKLGGGLADNFDCDVSKLRGTRYTNCCYPLVHGNVALV